MCPAFLKAEGDKNGVWRITNEAREDYHSHPLDFQAMMLLSQEEVTEVITKSKLDLSATIDELVNQLKSLGTVSAKSKVVVLSALYRALAICKANRL